MSAVFFPACQLPPAPDMPVLSKLEAVKLTAGQW